MPRRKSTLVQASRGQHSDFFIHGLLCKGARAPGHTREGEGQGGHTKKGVRTARATRRCCHCFFIVSVDIRPPPHDCLAMKANSEKKEPEPERLYLLTLIGTLLTRHLVHVHPGIDSRYRDFDCLYRNRVLESIDIYYTRPARRTIIELCCEANCPPSGPLKAEN
ncbi:MAG: hypothetical protein JWQ21_2929 [Herminiimonas sp.]|nr:hypothetical protein [Herminiimonas sp.]